MPLGYNMAVCQNLVPLVNIKIAGKWMFIPLKMVLIGIDPYPYMCYHHIVMAKSFILQLPWISWSFLIEAESRSAEGRSGAEDPGFF
jgi:hypothetical protein